MVLPQGTFSPWVHPLGEGSEAQRQHGPLLSRPSCTHTLGHRCVGDGVGSRTSSICNWRQSLLIIVTESRSQTHTVAFSPVAKQHIHQAGWDGHGKLSNT